MRWHECLLSAGLLGTLTWLGAGWALPQDEVEARSPQASDEQIEVWIRQLGDEEYRAREQAMKSLESVGAAARESLERAAQSLDLEVRWRAERLLSRLVDPSSRESEPSRPSQKPDRLRPVRPDREEDRDRRRGTDGDLGELELHIDEMMRRLEEDFARADPSRDWPQWLERFERELSEPGALFERLPSGTSERCFSIARNGDRLSIRIDAEGRVKAEVSEKGHDRSLSAESAEAFEAEHRNVLESFGLDSLEGFGQGRIRLSPLTRNGSRWPLELRNPLAADSGPRLGVRIAEVDEVLRHHLGLSGGLLVDRVEPDSTAQALGLERWDIVLALNGSPIAEVEGLRRTFGALESGDEIRLEIVRRGQPRTLEGIR